MAYQHIPMSTFRHHPTTTDLVTGLTASLAGGIVAAIRRELALARKRRGYRQMLKWDNCRLKDIGVTREDVRQALRECGCRV
jgi:uncharacterized protein YjiS (DUF1127 family)